MNEFHRIILCKHIAGSRLYGTSTPESDYDYRGIYAISMDKLISPWFYEGTYVDKSEEDTVYYELKKFFGLVVDQNPNIIETLWAPDHAYLQTSRAFEYLRENRHLLLSKKAKHTFSGYAMAQMKRIKGHNKWINNPQPKERPAQKSYLSPVFVYAINIHPAHINVDDYEEDHRLIHYGNEIYGVYEAKGYRLWNPEGMLNTVYDEFPDHRVPKFIVKFNKAEYKSACERHKQYWDWKNNRNEKRSRLEEAYGMDTKHASHLVRLMRMAEEILELLEIRNGKWSYDELLEWATDVDVRLDDMYKKSDLPHSVNINEASKILTNAYTLAHIDMHHRNMGE
jgi:hypothetical protein